MERSQKRIAVISDLASFGRCALTVSIPILSAMGIECCPIPTAILSTNGAFPGCQQFDTTSQMRATIEHLGILEVEFDGILIGFLNQEKQVPLVIEFLRQCKKKNTKVILDPIMGDNGKMYSVTREQMPALLTKLCPYVDLLTPNLTEAALLTKELYQNEFATEERIHGYARRLEQLGIPSIVFTGCLEEEQIVNYIFQGSTTNIQKVGAERIGTGRCGTGDVFSSVLCGKLVQGKTLEEATQSAVSFLKRTLEYTEQLGTLARNGVCFEPFLHELFEL